MVMEKNLVTESRTYLLLDPARDAHGIIDHPRLESCTERHHIELRPSGLVEDFQWDRNRLSSPEVGGAVIAVHQGIPYGPQLKLAKSLLREKRRVWFWWPAEDMVEEIDDELLESFRNQLVARKMVTAGLKARNAGRSVLRGVYRLGALAGSNRARQRVQDLTPPPPVDPTDHERVHAELAEVLSRTKPIPADATVFEKRGAYFRFDFWAAPTSGGSYGHTCYVADALAKRASAFTCYMPHRYELLDDLGVQQVVLEAPYEQWPEDHILLASPSTYQQLRVAIESTQPSYIYERIVLGSYVGAKLSQDLQIPYIVEYNGSETSMRRSYEGRGYEHEGFYLDAEMAAFQQATFISVVSEPVKEDLVRRGVDPTKILLNPNGASPEAFSTLSPAERAALRQELGFAETDRVIGFTGTFGGWHGIDVLADSLKHILEHDGRARFLLIGDGALKPLVDQKIKQHRLQDRVACTGRVPQKEGARLLQACDLFVSPHGGHMVDSRFFGSPTKVFDYMACGKAIVASDLEQIGQVLSPALQMNQPGFPQDVPEARSVLCKPGHVTQFVEGVNYLLDHPDVMERLGRNAKKALVELYSWEKHVERLVRALDGVPFDTLADEVLPGTPKTHTEGAAPMIETDDHYKTQTQEQWNNDPCGSQYVEDALPDTLDWYLEVEAYRYGSYGPWMPETMEFAKHAGEKVLEIGAGLGTDLAQFAKNGAIVTDIDLSAGHLAHAKRNFELRGLDGTFIHHDAERLPFDDDSFDLVYSNGVIHHTPNTRQVVSEIFRILKPGGRTILMVYAENSLHYWRNLFAMLGMRDRQLEKWSMGEIMSRHVELNEGGQRPLVKVYTKKRLRALMSKFTDIEIVQRQLMPVERPWALRWIGADKLERFCGWNLIVKATKPKAP